MRVTLPTAPGATACASQRAPQLLPRARYAGLGASVVLTTWGAVVSAAWVSRSQVLLDGVSIGGVPKFNASIVFLLIGLAGCVRTALPASAAAVVWSRLVGMVAALVGALTIVEYATSHSILSEVLVYDWTDTAGTDGRPAPQAAIALLLVGGTALLTSRLHVLRDGLGVAAAAIAASGAVGHAVGAEDLYTVGGTYALPASVAAAVLLALVSMFALMDRSETEMLLLADGGPAGVFLRRLVLVVVGLPVLVGVVISLSGELGLSTGAAPFVVAIALATGSSVTWQAARSLERADAASARELDRFRTLVGALGDVVTVYDGSGRYEEVYGVDDFGLDSAALRGRTPVEVFGEAGRYHLEGVMASVGGAVCRFEWWMPRPEGEYLLETVVSPLADRHGTARVIGISRDVTEERRHSQVVRALVANLPSAVIVTDLKGHVLLTSGDSVHPPAIGVEEQTGDRTFLTVQFPITDERGSMTATGSIATDISDLKAAQSAVQAAWHETLRRIATAVEYRDDDTGQHLVRMSGWCGRIAEQLGVDDVRCAAIIEAATLHDAGKIAIPDSILLKPGSLTPDERRVMQTHTTIGHALLDGSDSELLDLAASIALCHHEWWDGSGYPGGRLGVEIPLEARIAAVADVYDALTSDRSYRSAFTHADAVAHLENERGRHFDPDVLDALFALFERDASAPIDDQNDPVVRSVV